MPVVVERGEELLKSEFVRGWVNDVLLVDKSSGKKDLIISC